MSTSILELVFLNKELLNLKICYKVYVYVYISVSETANKTSAG